MRMTIPGRRRILFLAACLALAGPPRQAPAAEPETIRVMSFNIWVGGDSGKQPLSQTAAVIKAAGADVVGLQEKSGAAPKGQPRPDNGAKIAALLGWHYFPQGGGSTAILSRYEIVGHTPEKWGAKLKTPSGHEFYLFNVHLAAAPYQPYQLLKIPYHDAPDLDTADQAIQAANEARRADVTAMLAEARAAMGEGLPMFVTGDFNEPSARDWTPAAAAAGLCPIAVEWPTTKAVEAAGFRDSFRSAFPDPVARPGPTWTPTTKPDDPKDHHDRIDFVFLRGDNVELRSVEIVGEAAESADIVVTPYPSDHRSVVAEVVVD